MPNDDEVHEQRREDRANISRLFTKVEDIGRDIAVIKTTLALRKECSAPNLCIDLKEDLNSVRLDVEELKTRRASISFGWQTWVVAGSALIVIATAVAELKMAWGK